VCACVCVRWQSWAICRLHSVTKGWVGWGVGGRLWGVACTAAHRWVGGGIGQGLMHWRRWVVSLPSALLVLSTHSNHDVHKHVCINPGCAPWELACDVGGHVLCHHHAWSVFCCPTGFLVLEPLCAVRDAEHIMLVQWWPLLFLAAVFCKAPPQQPPPPTDPPTPTPLSSSQNQRPEQLSPLLVAFVAVVVLRAACIPVVCVVCVLLVSNPQHLLFKHT